MGSKFVRTRRALLLAVIPMLPTLALGQSPGGYRQFCQQVTGGRIVCKQAPGSAGAVGAAPYERWQDGSQAGSSGGYAPSSDQYQDLGRSNRLYNFPR